MLDSVLLNSWDSFSMPLPSISCLPEQSRILEEVQLLILWSQKVKKVILLAPIQRAGFAFELSLKKFSCETVL